MKVKIFMEFAEKLEPRITEWLKENECIEIVNTSQSTANSMVVLIIFYDETGYKLAHID